MPNLANRRVLVNGKEQRLKVCAQCMRTLNKAEKGKFAASLTKSA